MSRKQRKSKRRTVHPIVRQIIDRDCHVSMRNREVIRHVISRLKDGYTAFRAMPREDRKELMRQCVQVHRENWELYRDVMSGDVSGRLRRRRSKRKEATS